MSSSRFGPERTPACCRTGPASLINHYFDAFPHFSLYDDVVRTLDRLSRRYRLVVVSNIDDDLLALTPLQREFDLICTAERARGYKPDGALFRYLIEHAGCTKQAILHAGQSQFTDLVGGKPLGLTIAWIIVVKSSWIAPFRPGFHLVRHSISRRFS